MHRILKGFTRNMVHEAGKSTITPAHVIVQGCRSETRLASKLNGTERYSYEV